MFGWLSSHFVLVLVLVVSGLVLLFYGGPVARWLASVASRVGLPALRFRLPRRSRPEDVQVSDTTDAGFGDFGSGAEERLVTEQQTGAAVARGSQFCLGVVVPPGSDRDAVADQLAALDGKGGARARVRTLDRRAQARMNQKIYNPPDLPMMVIGSSGSGKSSAMVIPAILCQVDCSTFSASVKPDVAQKTYLSRLAVARRWNETRRADEPEAFVGIYSPDPATIPPELRPYAVSFSPLTTAGVYASARRSAKSLVEAALTVGGAGSQSDNAKFFNSSAISALADLLFLLSVGGQNRTMRDVYELVAQGSQTMEWSHIDELAVDLLDRSEGLTDDFSLTPAEVSQVQAATKRFAGLTVLTKSGAGAQASGVVSTLLRTTEIYGTSAAGDVEARAATSINFTDFLSTYSTLYVCPPAADGQDYIADLACLSEQMLQCLDAICASTSDARLPVRCNISLDELANLSLVSGERLKRIVSTVRSMNASLLLAAQDLSQLHDRYGQLVTNSVLSNCRSRCFLPGIACPITTQFMEGHFGRRRVKVVSRQVNPGSESRTVSKGEGGSTSVSRTEETSSHTVSWQEVPLMPQNRASELYPTEMFASTGSSKLHLLQVRYYADPDLLALSEGRLNPYDLVPDASARSVSEDAPDVDSFGNDKYEI